MRQSNVIRVMVVDDHPVWRKGVIWTIEQQENMMVVAEAANGQEALELFARHQPDVVLMDLRMPVMDGVTAITHIRNTFPSARILMLTTYNSEEDIYQGLNAGAKGYLLKDVPYEQLLEAIRTIHTGRKYLPQQLAVRLVDRMQQTELTPREMQVLELISQGKSNREIADILFIVEGTVKVHVSNILMKMGVEDRIQAVMVALRRGLLHLE